MKRGVAGRYEVTRAGGEEVRALMPDGLLYLKKNRAEYYRLLDLVRPDGDWEAWLDFFLEGVEQTAAGAMNMAQRLVIMFKEAGERLKEAGRAAITVTRVFEAFRSRPILTIGEAGRRSGMTFPSATKAIANLIKLGIAREITGRRRNRVFAYSRYLKILSEGTERL